MPTSVDAEGHIDDPWPAELTWGPLSNAGGAQVTWDTATLSCAGSYCHGATFAAPGPSTEPVWTSSGPSVTGCGSCHQFPPPAPHPTNNQCGDCHAPTAEGQLIANAATHIDGILQVDVGGGGVSCASGCHGDADQPAPPLDNAGNSDTTAPGVGAHQAHLNASLGATVACATCHPVPTAVGDSPHNNGTTDVIFSGVANSQGVDSSYDSNTRQCATYCHGDSLGGGNNTAPIWNVVDGSQAACGTCHSTPPPPPHPASSACSNCHGAGGTSVSANHIDGTLQVETMGGSNSCASGCHGDADQPAPPLDNNGNSDTTAPGVGAHQAHLNANLGAPVACATCHPVPTAVGDSPHNDGTTDVIFSGVANSQGIASSYDSNTRQCATYCHGDSLGGGSNTAPTWTTVDGTQAACGTCHSTPPPPPHPSSSACANCHSSGGTSNAANHIDGRTNF